MVLKKDIFDSLLNAIIRLGKNDIQAAKKSIDLAKRRIEEWEVERPEKKAFSVEKTAEDEA